MLVECAWSYQFPPRSSKDKQVKVEAVPQAVREIAWKAQSRLNQRYRALLRRGKLKNVAIRQWLVSLSVSSGQSPRRLARLRLRSTPRSRLWPANQDGTRNGSMLIGKVVTREPCTGARSGEIKSRATAGAEPRHGNSRHVPQADRKIDARFQTGKAPDGHTDMREPANKRLLTDVSRLCSYRCTIIVPIISSEFVEGTRCNAQST
jgi:hypothetical protein